MKLMKSNYVHFGGFVYSFGLGDATPIFRLLRRDWNCPPRPISCRISSECCPGASAEKRSVSTRVSSTLLRVTERYGCGRGMALPAASEASFEERTGTAHASEPADVTLRCDSKQKVCYSIPWNIAAHSSLFLVLKPASKNSRRRGHSATSPCVEGLGCHSSRAFTNPSGKAFKNLSRNAA